jgi:hypothetical protein
MWDGIIDIVGIWFINMSDCRRIPFVLHVEQWEQKSVRASGP